MFANIRTFVYFLTDHRQYRKRVTVTIHWDLFSLKIPTSFLFSTYILCCAGAARSSLEPREAPYPAHNCADAEIQGRAHLSFHPCKDSGVFLNLNVFHRCTHTSSSSTLIICWWKEKTTMVKNYETCSIIISKMLNLLSLTTCTHLEIVLHTGKKSSVFKPQVMHGAHLRSRWLALILQPWEFLLHGFPPNCIYVIRQWA